MYRLRYRHVPLSSLGTQAEYNCLDVANDGAHLVLGSINSYVPGSGESGAKMLDLPRCGVVVPKATPMRLARRLALLASATSVLCSWR